MSREDNIARIIYLLEQAGVIPPEIPSRPEHEASPHLLPTDS